MCDVHRGKVIMTQKHVMCYQFISCSLLKISFYLNLHFRTAQLIIYDSLFAFTKDDSQTFSQIRFLENHFHECRTVRKIFSPEYRNSRTIFIFPNAELPEGMLYINERCLINFIALPLKNLLYLHNKCKLNDFLSNYPLKYSWSITVSSFITLDGILKL